MNVEDQELIHDFVIESQEGLADVERQMLAIEAAGANIDVEQVNAVFRTMHSIKGAAGFLGLERIGALAHRLEELLNHMRNREIIPTTELVTIMLKAADCMSGLIGSIETSNEVDISAHVDVMEKFLPSDKATSQPEPSASEAFSTPTLPEAPASPPAAPLPSNGHSSEAVREFLIESYDNLEQMDRDLLALEQSPKSAELLRAIFRTMHTIKGGAGFLGFTKLEQLAHVAEGVLGKLRDGSTAMTTAMMTALLESTDQCREGLKLVEVNGAQDFDPQPTIERLQASLPGAQGVATTAPSVSEPPASPKLASSVPASPAPAQSAPPAPVQPPRSAPASATTADSTADKGQATIGDSTIRVDVALLDKLMTRVGELVLARNQILQHASRIENADVTSAAQRLNLITTELQEGVMKTRMQPIGNVWTKFPRVVRDLAFQLNKQISIDLEGKETELDKTIIEAIKDPLTHLVRNSVDHGIEAPAVRVAAGKNPEGRLLLRAYHEGGQVNIEITDDGAGLNLDRIRKKAVERGILSLEQANRMTEQEAAQLIFAAGFSTAEQVTSVSGRGVGMDVVKTNIERIGGAIDVQSKTGRGTTIRIKIPLTLAIIPALTVVCEGDRYAIPQISLLELVRLEGKEAREGIETIHGAPVYRLRGKLLPLIYLSERLGLGPAKGGLPGNTPDGEDADRPLNIVVLRADDRHFGLIVDKVCDTEEIVVKPLSKQLKKIGEYAGATIMGDGSVALILDVKGVADAAGLGAEQRVVNGHDEILEASRSKLSRDSVLVVDVGDSRRFALPIAMISRLERVQRSVIEHTDGREVMQYRGTILPLLRLGSVMGGAVLEQEQSEELQLVVYAKNGSSYGLIVGNIVDTCDTHGLFDADKPASGLLLQTSVIQQRVTDVVDLDYLAREFVIPSRAAKILEHA